MIKTKKELIYCLSEDRKRFNGKTPSLKDWILKNEWAYIYRYIRTLRYLEYYLNTGNLMMYYGYFLRYKRMCFI